MTRVSIRRGLRGGALVLMLSVLVGCGGGKKTATVKGKVTVDGQAVTGGAVTFHGADGRIDSGAIKADGEYTIARAPVGEVTATVLPSQPQTARAPGGKTPGAKDKQPDHPGAGEKTPEVKSAPVPRKYHTKEASGLKYTIKSGEQTINIELSSKDK